MDMEKTMNLVALSGEGGLTPEEIAEELGGDMPEYPRVKIPAGGGVSFEVPGDDPESPDSVKKLIGVVVHHHKTNAYWVGKELSDAPPDCSSTDGINGRGTPGGSCAACPLNQFGSGEGGAGKACKNMERLYILQENRLLPLALSLPPTSLRNWKNYKTLLITKGKRVCSVFTEITLTKQTSRDGITYSEAVFRIGEPLPPELSSLSYQYRQGVKEIVAAGFDGEPKPLVDHDTGEVI